MLKRIVAGGQTGVDRGALNAALFADVEAGGWCPKGRRAEDGTIPEIYPMRETASPDYADRTRANVKDSDATLILSRDPRLTGGTKLTRQFAVELKKPYLLGDPTADIAEETCRVADWIEQENVEVLNVAGPRESGEPGIQAEAEAFIVALIDAVAIRRG